MHPMRFEQGAEFGNYRIVERAGRGGMATVYKAYQAALARYVAIKVLPDYLADEPGFLERFQREAVAVAGLRHPSIPAVFDYGTIDDVTYIVTEYIDGGTLSEQLGSPLPPEYVVEVLRPIASALDYAHARNVVHRDIKPPNIMLTLDGRPILNDFGIAQIMGSEAKISSTGTIIGTPQYMAPEQCQGESVGPPVDIYALSVVAYEMLTGRVPFVAATPAAVILAQIHDPLPPPRSIHPEISDAVEAVLLKGLAKKPADRYRTASAMVGALADAAKELPAPARASAAPEESVTRPMPAPVRAPAPAPPAAIAARAAPAVPPRPLGGSRRLPLILAGVLVLVLLAGGGGVIGLRALQSRSGGGGPSQQGGGGGSQVPSVVGTPMPTLTDRPLAKGPLVWSADSADAFENPEIKPDGSIDVDAGKGILKLVKRDGHIRLKSKMPEMKDFIAEVEATIAPGSRLTLQWNVRQAAGTIGDHVYSIDTTRTSMAFEYLPPAGSTDPPQEMGERYILPQATNGKTFTLTVDLRQDEYVSYLDGTEFDDTSDDRNPGSSVLELIMFGESGQVKLNGMRVYSLP